MSAAFWKDLPDGLEVAVRATPKGGRDSVDGPKSDANGDAWLAVRVTAPADDGKANKAVTKLLAFHFGVPVRDVALVSGATARLKRFRLRGDPESLAALAHKLTQEG